MNKHIRNKNVFWNQRGSGLIGAMLVVLVLGVAGTAAIDNSASQTVSNSNEMENAQALYVGQAGLEYTKQRLNMGLSPDISDKQFANGKFTISSDPGTGVTTVLSEVGNAQKTQRINSRFSRHCVALDVSQSQTEDSQLLGVKLVKTCNNAAIVNKMWIGWNFNSCALEDSATDGSASEGTDDPYADYRDPENPDHVLICHVPPGSPDQAHTLSVDVSGWEHGHSKGTGRHSLDSLGSCETEFEEEEVAVNDCEITDADAKVINIGMEGTEIYNTQGIGTPVLGAEDLEMIDVEDFVLSANGNYVFVGPPYAINFNQTLPIQGGLYTITIEFADGSYLTDTFETGPSGLQDTGAAAEESSSSPSSTESTDSTSLSPDTNTSADTGATSEGADASGTETSNDYNNTTRILTN